ncbi:hypothetical protein [Phaeodactylibacter sp.]|jgi:hypothetical protein|uniref:hypothetical protein n=1 Tax=Phaeodactylibacter sp. TaxID=1940289 RepID=UPI0026010D40|nr:hypothetical protein [Phaeodactylibacter sp.]MCI4651172.1 hypothetical protein [Phaeodactylibacter sp.]MCI5090465.1 hypothetical protein [Phaeodactylibacter sp.]
MKRERFEGFDHRQNYLENGQLVSHSKNNGDAPLTKGSPPLSKTVYETIVFFQIYWCKGTGVTTTILPPFSPISIPY